MHNLENSNLGLKFQIGKTQYLQQYPPKSTQESVNVVLEQNFKISKTTRQNTIKKFFAKPRKRKEKRD